MVPLVHRLGYSTREDVALSLLSVAKAFHYLRPTFAEFSWVFFTRDVLNFLPYLWFVSDVIHCDSIHSHRASFARYEARSGCKLLSKLTFSRDMASNSGMLPGLRGANNISTDSNRSNVLVLGNQTLVPLVLLYSSLTLDYRWRGC